MWIDYSKACLRAQWRRRKRNYFTFEVTERQTVTRAWLSALQQGERLPVLANTPQDWNLPPLADRPMGFPTAKGELMSMELLSSNLISGTYRNCNFAARTIHFLRSSRSQRFFKRNRFSANRTRPLGGFLRFLFHRLIVSCLEQERSGNCESWKLIT